MKRVSVVILNWNGVDMLRKFIPSVMDNSVGEGIEICVADNASSDGSLEMLRSEFPVVRLIELDQNYGFADGYNLALKQVEAEYVVPVSYTHQMCIRDRIVNEENWGLKKLAYPIQTKSTGFYQLIEFNAEHTVIEKLEINFRRDERVIRFLTLSLIHICKVIRNI